MSTNCTILSSSWPFENEMPLTIPYNDDFAKFMFVFGMLTSCIGFVQVYWIVKSIQINGDARGVSWISNLVLLFSNITFVIYGLMLRDAIVTLTSVIPCISLATILGLLFFYEGVNEFCCCCFAKRYAIERESQESKDVLKKRTLLHICCCCLRDRYNGQRDEDKTEKKYLMQGKFTLLNKIKE